MRKITKITALALVIVLIGCFDTNDPNFIKTTTPGPFPSDYKKILKLYIKQNFFDPYSMRDVAISAPVEGRMSIPPGIASVPGWIVCLQANSKNRMGGYTGLTRISYLVKYGSVERTFEGDPFCDTAQLVPWPEMENNGSGTKSQRAQ